MSHWAEIDNNNLVVRVTTGNNADEDEGYQWLINNLGGRWVKASYNTYQGVHINGGTPLRKNYPGVGFTYNEDLDAFIPPKEFSSWVLNNDKGIWEPPIPYPGEVLNDPFVVKVEYIWDENSVSWVKQSTGDVLEIDNNATT